MGRCKEFYDKWEREPNWCEKCQRSVEFINSYMDLADVLEQMGVPKKRTFVRLREGPARPIFQKRNICFKQKLIEVLAQSLKTEDKQWNTAEIKKLISEFRRKTTNRKITPSSPITMVLKQGDFRELIKQVADNSIDCVLTDPPYEPEFLPQWGELAKESARVLKPSGFFLSYSGWMFLPQILDYLQTHLFYYWTIPLLMMKGNHSRIFPRHIFQETKPILVFQKPPLKPQEKWIPDLLENPKADKELHSWGQGVKPLVSLLESFTQEGDMILDPLVGGGATIEACALTKRSVTAFELDADTYKLLMSRVEGVEYGKVST